MCLCYYAKLTLKFFPLLTLSGHRGVTKTSRARPFPLLGRAFRTLRVREEGVHGGEKQAATKTIKRRGTDESKPNEQRVEEDFSGGRYWLVQKGMFSIARVTARGNFCFG